MTSARAWRRPLPASRERSTAPTDPLAAGTSYGLVFETSCGSFTVGLDTELAPNTAASLVALAREGFFDDTVFHRIVPGFVIQGGDPTQTVQVVPDTRRSTPRPPAPST